MGQTRSDEGTYINGVLELDGAVSDNWWGPNSYSIMLPYGTEPDPELAIDYSYVNDLFQYHMVAVSSVPEPEPSLLMLAGIGLLGYVVRRRKSV
ncbi:MAG: PEP-CTERM sorting domain-containing protein [Gammaproteobacteria bacterium]|nr:PEP-CTERM sorting domain-containing protein [Gammaproteobacteria bacterium]